MSTGTAAYDANKDQGMHRVTKAREHTPDYMPMALEIDGEPVWAEVANPNEDLCVWYITGPHNYPPFSQGKHRQAWHIWEVYDNEDGTLSVQAYPFNEDVGHEPPEDFPTFQKAIQEIAILSE